MDIRNSGMEQQIIAELLEKSGVQPDETMVDSYLNLIKLGFDHKWLRNMCILREFDEAYKVGDETMSTIYIDLSIKYKIHEGSIRRLMAPRS